MARYLDPKADLTFKKIFGQHPKLLISFLNAVMPFKEDRHIVEVEYLSSEMVPENPGKKYSIVDVRCIDNHQCQFIVEMQANWEEGFMSRILFNASKAYIRQLDKGEEYDLLQPVYTLVILSDNFTRQTKQFYHHFKIINVENSKEIIEGLEFVLMELTEKFKPETISDRKLMVLWLRFLKELDNMKELPPEMMENEEIRMAAELCEESAFTPIELATYEKYWDMVRTEKTAIKSAMQKGMQKGMQEGMQKGRQEEKSEIAVKMLKKGMSIEDVSDTTGLSIKQIKDIIKT